MNYTQEVFKLFELQKTEWPLMAANYNGLKKVLIKELCYRELKLKVQFNPERIRSSSAKVDKKSIQERPCFLCSGNRPKEQRAIEFMETFLILVNPFPIFPFHLTIVQREHVKQELRPYFGYMLDLAASLDGFTVFYNGPRCGASAPDHFHFQAGNRGFMPIDDDINFYKSEFGNLQRNGEVKVWKIDDSVRKYFVFESEHKSALIGIFLEYLSEVEKIIEVTDEPDMNVLASYEKGIWRVIVFPRYKHRPWQYFAEGDDNILISPASVDFGGVLISPLEKDFLKLTENQVCDILRQVCLPVNLFNEINF